MHIKKIFTNTQPFISLRQLTVYRQVEFKCLPQKHAHASSFATNQISCGRHIKTLTQIAAIESVKEKVKGYI